MIDYESLFKISYGLFIISSGDSKAGGGYIGNVFFQATAEPPKFAISCNKNNYTRKLIEKYKYFAVSILSQDASTEIISRFGYRSGRDFNKLEGLNIKYLETGAPIIVNESISFVECNLSEAIDLGSHIMFIGEAVNAESFELAGEPLTYSHYRKTKKATAPKNAPTYIDDSKLIKNKRDSKKYKCSLCGYIYDDETEGEPFENLPDDWTCPTCGASKSDFYQI